MKELKKDLQSLLKTLKVLEEKLKKWRIPKNRGLTQEITQKNYRLDEVADYFSTSMRTVYRLIDERN